MNKQAKSDNDIIGFLLGEKPYEGNWFHETASKQAGAHWWRKYLRRYINQQQEEIEKLKSRLDELVKSLEGMQVEGIEEEGLIYRVVAYSKLQSIVSKAKGQANVG